MHTDLNLRRVAGTVALMATSAGVLGALASPAGAQTGASAVLQDGIVVVTGTEVNDRIGLTSDANQLVVDFGFDGTVDAQFARASYRAARVQALGGADNLSLRGSGDVPITMSGNAGGDVVSVSGSIGETGEGDAATTLNGNGGNDRLFATAPGPVTVQAGAGDDLVRGGEAGIGRETISLGDGNDRFISSLNTFVGDRSDVVDGGAGQDSLQAEGTFADEGLNLSAEAGKLVMRHNFRDRIDADNVEDVRWIGFGGLDAGDAVSVNDLTGTDVVRFTPDFSAGPGIARPNGSADNLTVRGTDGVDRITVTGSGSDLTVAGLTPLVTAVFVEPHDFLLIDTLGGNDVVDTSGLQPGLVQLLQR
ncbi:MAG TPA: hypothetical protein VFI47_03270 [Acidimicrobiales bacterium]|nr:hypothetical protein [Acidimicrobiales bacterium]